jgi:hypothetical protein
MKEVVSHGSIELVNRLLFGLVAKNRIFLGGVVPLVVITDLAIYLSKLGSSFHIWNNISFNHRNSQTQALELSENYFISSLSKHNQTKRLKYSTP